MNKIRSLLPDKCLECRFAGITDIYRTCDYILYTGHPRGCSVEECTYNTSDIKKMPSPRWASMETKKKKYVPLEKDDLTQILMPYYEQRLTDGEISQITGITKQRIYSWRTRHNLKSARERASIERSNLLRKYYDMGLNDREISDATGIGPCEVGSWRMQNGLESHYNEIHRGKDDEKD